MKKAVSLIWIVLFSLSSLASAAPRSISLNRGAEQVAEQGVEKPQMARDLEGLDPREATVSQGLRGSFTIRHYVSGPYKGGTAVIELASDSSYAEVRIFDPDGNLQRIYSIQPKSQNARLTPSQMQDPAAMARDNQTGGARGSDAENSTNVTRSRAREAAVEAQTAQAMQQEKEAQERATAMSPRTRRGTVSSRAGDIREEQPVTEVASLPVQSRPPSVQPSTVLVKHVKRVRRKRPVKKKSSALDTPLSGEAPKKQEEYYYEEVVTYERRPVASEQRETQVAKAEPAPTPVPTPPQSTSSSSSKSKRGKSDNSGTPSSGSAARDLDHAPAHTPTEIASASGGQGTTAASGSSAYDEASLPDVAEAVHDNETESTGNKGKSGAKNDSKAKAADMKDQGAGARAAAAAEARAQEESKAAALAEARTREEARARDEAKARAEAEADKATSPEKVGKKHLDSDEWKPKTVQVAQLPGSAVELPSPAIQSPTRGQPTPEPVDIKEAQKAAAKLESDGWSPKQSKPTVSDAELGLGVITDAAGGKSGKGSKKGGSYDDMVPMSDQAKGSQVGAGDTWSPRTRSEKLSPKDEQQLAMINTMKSGGTPGQMPVSRMNRDINNPEEGVKPFYSLEKYSGAQFGRHREFERRVMYKQNPSSSMKGYEFYIDEVDRKQEKHYLYYYKIDSKTKKAKLIATEKHEKVTFLGNYDIGSEDKGKISKE